MSERFLGKCVIVTGASSGIGAEAAKMFAAEGARLVLTARTADALEQVARETGAEAHVIPSDLGDPASIRDMLERAHAALGRIDVLVNNAGTNARGPVEDVDDEALARIVDVNLRGPVVASRLVLPFLREAGGGAIVNVASLAGHVPLPEEATYSATKFGLRAFTFALAQELEGSGITVSAVSPGPVDTGFITEDLEEVPPVVFSQPMSSAEDVARLIVECAADGTLERTCPASSGYLATVGYLAPGLLRLLRPVLDWQGQSAKERFIEKHRASKADPA